MLYNGCVEILDCLRVEGPPLVLLFGSTSNPTPHPAFSCATLVMAFSRDTVLVLSMTLVCLSGAKSLRDPLVSQLLGECVASSSLAKGPWAEATNVGFPSLIHTKQVEVVK